MEQDPFVEWQKSQEPVEDPEIAHEAAKVEEKTRRIARELKLPPKEKKVFDEFADLEAGMLLREKEAQKKEQEAKTRKLNKKAKK